MKTLLSKLVTGVVVIGVGSRAVFALSLSLEPTPQTINVGDSTSIDLVISDLGNLSAPSLGAFDFDLSYDPAIISATSVAFGSSLDLGIFGSLQFSDLTTPGLIHVDEISFETPTDLDAAQPDSFVLATLNFSGVAPGISAIIFDFASLSDELGQALEGFSLSTGAIEVAALVSIPDIGSTGSLLLLGLAGLCAFRRTPSA